jgi:hypothetical protein
MTQFGTYERWENGGTWYFLVRHKKIMLDKGLELVLSFEVRPRTSGTRKQTQLTPAERTPRPITLPSGGTRQRENGSQVPHSGYRGVSWHQSGQRWQVQVRVEGRVQHWGSFKDVQEAALRYDAVVLAFRGPGAPTHLVPDTSTSRP